MTRAISRIKGVTRYFRRYYSNHGDQHLRKVPTIRRSLNSIDLDQFRKDAFIPETPVIISNAPSGDAVPAEQKWFKRQDFPNENTLRAADQQTSLEYLTPFADTILPYELYSPPTKPHNGGSEKHDTEAATQNVASALNEIMKAAPDSLFHRFNAPLALFLQASTLPPLSRPKLYIAQAQIADLPPQLQADLPTPHLVTDAGKGDIYDANIWMGIPPTYTPLHKDPNPNLFVQLASKKRVRLFPSRVGMEIFRKVQMEIGQNASSAFRGNEMMEGICLRGRFGARK